MLWSVIKEEERMEAKEKPKSHPISITFLTESFDLSFSDKTFGRFHVTNRSFLRRLSLRSITPPNLQYS